MAWWKKTRRVPPLQVGACTDVGRVRSENQDAYGYFPAEEGSSLFLVADGMGGHAGGREASRAAVEAVQQAYFAAPEQATDERLRAAFEAANAWIFRKADGRRGTDRMGTTCTALALTDGQVYLAHVGDSRAYRLRGSTFELISRDHTMVEELYREGVLSDEEARHHPERHTLTRAVGLEAALEVDVRGPMPLSSGDCFLLCSDGLAPVPEDVLLQTVRAHPPQAACERLVEQANERGGLDNVTVLIVSIS